jgi:flavin reductase (DIM6/NTAB) family NADH-FMN oxidoreductase RutF
VYDGGDHSIIVGQVVGVTNAPDDRGPLIHHQGKYRNLAAIVPIQTT